MKLKRDTKFWMESTPRFKIGTRNLTIWPDHLKVSKIFTFMGYLWAKNILFELKNYTGVIFHETERGYNVWRGINLSSQNWHKKSDNFWPEHS